MWSARDFISILSRAAEHADTYARRSDSRPVFITFLYYLFVNEYENEHEYVGVQMLRNVAGLTW